MSILVRYYEYIAMKRYIGLLALVLLATTVFAQSDPADAARSNVSYPAQDGTTLRGYLATPSGEGPFPAVLMIHEWWGLNVEDRKSVV